MLLLWDSCVSARPWFKKGTHVGALSIFSIDPIWFASIVYTGVEPPTGPHGDAIPGKSGRLCYSWIGLHFERLDCLFYEMSHAIK